MPLTRQDLEQIRLIVREELTEILRDGAPLIGRPNDDELSDAEVDRIGEQASKLLARARAKRPGIARARTTA